jgi:uncharacterized GH25 family protein
MMKAESAKNLVRAEGVGMRWVVGLAVTAGTIFASSSAAHFNMLLPDTASAKKGETITFTYQWGHPFEHQLFDALPPSRVIVWAPDGKKTDLTSSLKAMTLPAGNTKTVKAYQLTFTPEERGDFIFVLQTPPIWMEEDGEYLQDTVKVVLHVQAQKGWEASTGGSFEVRPLTRPYGLTPGMVFQALLQGRSTPEAAAVAPLPGLLFEIEAYNPKPPRQLPPDEHITRTVQTDPKGVIVCTLTDPGWWVLTASRKAGERQRDGKMFPLLERSSLWVFVDEKPAK